MVERDDDAVRVIKEAVFRLSPLPDGEWEAFVAALIRKSYGKGEFLCREGMVEEYIFFLLKGATRNYFLRNGKDHTIEFHFEHEFVTSYFSFLTGQPSAINIEALEDIDAFMVHKSTLYKLYARSREGERIGRLIAEYQYTRRLQREMEFLSFSAEERYAALLQRNPSMVGRISVKHISSYLGVQPESLSRIRKAISGN